MFLAASGISAVGVFAILFVLTLLTCLIVGAVFAVFRVGKNHGALAAIGLAVALLVAPFLGFAAVLSIFYVRVNTVTEALHLEPSLTTSGQDLGTGGHGEPTASAGPSVSVERVRVERVSPLPSTPPVSWVSATDLGEFQASLYPGIVECAEPLAQNIGEVLQQQSFAVGLDEASQGEGVQFLIRMEDDFIYQADQFVSSFMKSLQRRFPRAELTRRSVVRDKPMTLESNEVSLTLSAQVESGEPTSWDSSVLWQSGVVACQIDTNSNTSHAKLRFSDKPWVSRFDEVAFKFPNRQFVVGYSAELASSESQARQSALDNVRSRVNVKNWNGARVTFADEHVVDRFTQKLSRPYGDVWREAILVDLTGEQIRWTEAGIMADTSRPSEMKRLPALYAVLLLLVTVVVCFLANVLTQGYYRKPVNKAVVTAIVLVVFGGLLFLGLTIA